MMHVSTTVSHRGMKLSTSATQLLETFLFNQTAVIVALGGFLNNFIHRKTVEVRNKTRDDHGSK